MIPCTSNLSLIPWCWLLICLDSMWILFFNSSALMTFMQWLIPLHSSGQESNQVNSSTNVVLCIIFFPKILHFPKLRFRYLESKVLMVTWKIIHSIPSQKGEGNHPIVTWATLNATLSVPTSKDWEKHSWWVSSSASYSNGNTLV